MAAAQGILQGKKSRKKNPAAFPELLPSLTLLFQSGRLLAETVQRSKKTRIRRQ